MQYRRLGRFGLKVSPLCLGTMMFGGETDEQVAQKIVRHAFEAGINFIDSADAYNKGRSEEVTGGPSLASASAGWSQPSWGTRWARGRTAAVCRANG